MAHGYLVGDYIRDKDAAGAAMILAEFAADAKAAGRTLWDELDLERLEAAWQVAVFALYLAEKSSCRSFPEPAGDGLQNGPKRNYQILSPLDFLAEFTQHRPSLCSGARAKGSHLVRGHRPKVGHGWYPNKSRGVRNKRAAESSEAVEGERQATGRSGATWAMLIKRVYELTYVDQDTFEATF